MIVRYKGSRYKIILKPETIEYLYHAKEMLLLLLECSFALACLWILISSLIILRG